MGVKSKPFSGPRERYTAEFWASASESVRDTLRDEYRHAREISLDRLRRLGESEAGQGALIYQNNVNRFDAWKNVSEGDKGYAIADLYSFYKNPLSKVGNLNRYEEKSMEIFKKNYPEFSGMTRAEYRNFARSMGEFRARKGRKARYSDDKTAAIARLAMQKATSGQIRQLMQVISATGRDTDKELERINKELQKGEKKAAQIIQREFKSAKYDAGRERNRGNKGREMLKRNRANRRR